MAEGVRLNGVTNGFTIVLPYQQDCAATRCKLNAMNAFVSSGTADGGRLFLLWWGWFVARCSRSDNRHLLPQSWKRKCSAWAGIATPS